jgi:hypothetical protein
MGERSLRKNDARPLTHADLAVEVMGGKESPRLAHAVGVARDQRKLRSGVGFELVEKGADVSFDRALRDAERDCELLAIHAATKQRQHLALGT